MENNVDTDNLDIEYSDGESIEFIEKSSLDCSYNVPSDSYLSMVDYLRNTRQHS